MISLSNLNLYLFLLLIAFLRVAVSSNVALGVDEAHYVLYGLNPALSYFDHPPLVGWTQALFINIFGDGELGVRVSAIIIGFFSSLLIYKLIFKISNSVKSSVISAIALNASFMFNALFFMLLPETILFMLLVPIILVTLNIDKEPSLKNWLILGLLMGIAGLTKYTAILFVIPIAIYFVVQKKYSYFLSFGFFVSIIVALILVSPVILWNMQNEWISFSYQSEHVVGDTHIDWRVFAQSVAAQFGAYNPFLWILSFYGLFKAVTSKDKTLFLSALFGITLLLFFWYASLYKRALPHWSALFYYIFIPIGTYYMYKGSKRAKKYLNFSIIFGLVVTLILYLELIFKFIPLSDYNSPHRDIYGWDRIMQQANELLKPNEALAVTNWTVASRAIYYNRNHNSELFLVDNNRYDQFDIWNSKSPINRDLIFINTHFFKEPIALKFRCDSVKKLKSFNINLNGSKVNSIELIECKNFKGYR
ncbi:MAG: glycosyltransferase family 39 protein [Campylobacterota bacterium]|nr:glycosyltransferase family 39 protein [Campylobacterota bacterium]